MAKEFGEPIELTVGEHVVRVSNPQKPYFPEVGITKIEVVQHYLDCGEGILRALRERPTTLERWPGGVVEGARISTREGFKGEAFYQKRVPQGAPPYVETAHITFPSGRTADEVAPTDLAVIAWAAQLGTVTFHPWPVRRDDVEHPDELRLDLDPGPGTDFRDAVEVAHVLHELLDELGIVGWPKTSGGRGVHVYVRIEPRWGFIDVRHAAIAIGRELERRMPGRVTDGAGGLQAPHVDVSVFARGLLHRVVTRIYFPQHAAEPGPGGHAQDPVLQAVPRARRPTLVARAVNDGYEHDLRLQGKDETVFFDV